MKTNRLLITLVLLGALLLTGCSSQVRVGALQTESQSVELGDAGAVHVEINLGAGDLEVTGGAEKLLEAGFNYNVARLKPIVEYSDGTLAVRQPGTKGLPYLGGITDFRNTWSLQLTDEVPMDLSVDVGAGTGDLQLAGLALTGLEVNLGAGEYTVDLSGDWVRDLDVTIDTGAASITVRLPSDVGVLVEVDAGPTMIEAAGLTQDGDVYTNAAYGVSEVTLQVNMEAGIGRINLEVAEDAAATVGPAMTQENRVAPGRKVLPALSQPPGPSDPAELEAFLNELFAKQMEEYQIAGAAISVVKDGKLFFARGYGYADLEEGIPVDPEQTVFRIGSVGKLFTWTAVMQLVEQGKLDLDADINDYLDFRIPDTYPQPITLKHLLTHTSGFEDSWLEVFAWSADDLMPVGEWLASQMPGRVRPPGIAAAYSNYGANLAGYIVARVSGQPYEQYIEENILNPLGMVHSTARVPLPPDLSAHASLGYWNVDGVFQAVPDYPEYFGQSAMTPAGGHSSSITDMARFMIAHLQNGHYSDAEITEGRILKETTMQQMHSTLYTPDPRILGTAYGFFDFSDNGQRTLGHSGGTLGFTTLLLLLPDQNLGVFVAYNSEGGGLTTQHFGFQRAFYDHYYPAPAAEPIQPAADFSERAGWFAGSYRSTQSAYTTFEKFGNIMSSVEISDLGDGALLLTVNGLEMRLVEVEPLYFRQADGPLGIVFREDDRGRITHMFADVSPQYAFEKLNWYETPRFNMALALGSVLIFLSMIPVVTITAIRNRRPSAGRKPTSPGARMAYWTILGISLLNLLFVIGTVLVFGSLGFPRFGVPLTYRIVLGLGVLSAVLTVGALVYAVLAWKNRYWGVAGRAYYTLVTVAAVAFVWFLDYWNLLGWRF